MILPDKGDSTWAFSSQLFKKITGVLTAKAKKIKQNKIIWVEWLKLLLDKASKSVLPIKEDIVNIANNKNKEPNT